VNDGNLQVAHELRWGKDERTIDVATKAGAGTVHVGMNPSVIDADSAVLRNLLIRYGAIVGLIGVALFTLLTRLIVVRPLRDLTNFTKVILEKGDLTQNISTTSDDEIGVLTRNFAEMVQKLREIPLAIKESTDILANSVADLSAFASGQSEVLTRQATALQETQVTAQEIKQTSLVAAQKAEGVLALTERADALGRGGEAAVEQSLSALLDIRTQVEEIAKRIASLSEKTLQIVDITQTVKDLADQSNMLALNAAIEAVRSGEHGRGFAVVAREIRSLADQSLQATKRVREILDDVAGAVKIAVSITEKGSLQINSGLAQVKSTGQQLSELSTIVKDNSAAMRQISAAVGQQNAGISQIFGAVTDQNKMMDDSMSRLRQSEQAVKTIEDVAIGLIKIVDNFTV
jgi:methyl-accepting chemotaxis protein